MKTKVAFFFLLGLFSLVTLAAASLLQPAQSPLHPSEVHLAGLAGARFYASLNNRLLTLDSDALVGCFEHRDCTFPWVGEYIGKWLDAAAITYEVTHDARLLAKLHSLAHRLIATQEADGYLGTYPEGKHFIFQHPYTWDVWVHKYVLIGLLRYWQATGDESALAAARRVGDLLVKTFGTAPGQKDIVSVGTHRGMAATSVLQPMVWLYRATGDRRYLAFCDYIVQSWAAPNGPHLLGELLARKPVYALPSSKAYEMLSNLVGLCELYQVTGKGRYLVAAKNAWKDIKANRLYLTGGASAFECFQPDNHFPFTADYRIQETCVTVSWLQLNKHLLALTGEAKYADAYLHTAYNQLLAAQTPSGAEWCYYNPLTGHKPYSTALCCCSANGPRGIAWFSQVAVTRDALGPVVNLYCPGSYGFTTPKGQKATLHIAGDFPFSGKLTLKLELSAPEAFTLKLLAPAWTEGATWAIGNGPRRAFPKGPAYVKLGRFWRSGDVVKVDLHFSPRVVPGGKRQPGLSALCYGPLVLSYDSAANPGAKRSDWKQLALPSPGSDLALRVKKIKGLEGPVFSVKLLSRYSGESRRVNLRPWATAGATGGVVRVWLPAFDENFTRKPHSLFAFLSQASQSRPGNVDGDFNDEDCSTFTVTYDGKPQSQAWFALELPKPVTFTTLVFCHGKTFHDGGWFDASKGKPLFQVKRTPDGPWEDLARLEAYPATTATDAKGLEGGEKFEVKLDRPITVLAIRIIGVPACGDNPNQAFASCAELQALP